MMRFLVMDDDKAAMKLYKSVFSKISDLSANSWKMENEFERTKSENVSVEKLDTVFCNSSIEAVNQVARAVETDNPFAVAFLDIKMERQKDGIWVGKQLRDLDPEIELVFVTGFSEYHPREIAKQVPPVHKMIYVQKPFGVQELIHLVHALGQKWLHEKNNRQMQQMLYSLVEEKTMALKLANEALEKKIKERTTHLEEANTALKVLLKQREEDKNKIGETIIKNVRQLIKPLVDKLRMTSMNSRQQNILDTLEANLEEITNPFLQSLNASFINLTPMEIQVAYFVKSGLSNKEIAEILCLSTGTIKIHRHNLRAKLNLKNKKVNLRTHLLSLD